MLGAGHGFLLLCWLARGGSFLVVAGFGVKRAGLRPPLQARSENQDLVLEL